MVARDLQLVVVLRRITCGKRHSSCCCYRLVEASSELEMYSIGAVEVVAVQCIPIPILTRWGVDQVLESFSPEIRRSDGEHDFT